jgi:diguanylate cyclase (GGDEF)-like protein
VFRSIAVAVVCLLAATFSPAVAASRPAIDASLDRVAADTAVLRDPTGHWTLDDVRKHSDRFQHRGTLPIDVRASVFAPSVLWFRLHPRSNDNQLWYVRLRYQVDRAGLYYVRADGTVDSIPFGMLVPVARRPVPSSEVLAPVPAGALHDGTLYLRIVTPDERFATFDLRPASWLLVHEAGSEGERLLALAATIGMVVALGLVGLILGVIFRDPIFLWYAGTMLALAIYEFTAPGLAWRFLWPALSLSYTPLVYLTYVVYLALVVAFSRVLLRLPETAPAMWRVLRIAYAIVFVSAAVVTVWPNLAERLDILSLLDPFASGLFLGAVLLSGFAVWRRQRDLLSATYCLAFGGGMIGMMIAAAGRHGLIHETLGTVAAAGIGAAWQAIFLGAALAERALASSQKVDILKSERDDLEAVALRDALTGVWNRRAFETRLADEWQRSVRSEVNLALVLFDVDHFKAYNDAYGHQQGDTTLAAVARCLGLAIRRPYDLLARYGGEEFVLLLPGCGLEDAKRIAESARAAVHAAEIPHPTAESGVVTVSVGVGGRIPGKVDDPAKLVAVADRALYAAKRLGRDRVVVA